MTSLAPARDRFVTERPLHVLQVSMTDVGSGGAPKIAWNLFQALRAREFESWLVVGSKRGKDADVLLMPLVATTDHCSGRAHG
jgi:hypothetical protein